MLGRRLLLWGAAFAMLLQSTYYYTRLPDRVASHFGPDGAADGWSSKGSLVGVMLVAGGSMWLLFEALAWLVPRFPAESINIPRRDYWLAPQRRAETVERIRGDLFEVGFLTMIWMIALNEVVMRANLEASPRLGAPFWWTLTIYLGMLGAWMVAFYRRYSRVPTTEGATLGPPLP